MMTFGLVISSYKYGHLASHCIETILAQTKPFDKVYFVDDGVGDCKHLASIYPNIEYTLRDKNLGVVQNFQNMLERVETQYVMFLGADNWLRSDALELIAKKVIGFNKVVTYDIMITGELKNDVAIHYPLETNETKGDIYWTRENKHHGSMLYDVKMALGVGGYAHNGGIRSDEDLNLWTKFLNRGVEIEYVNEALLYYRRHKENFNKY